MPGKGYRTTWTGDNVKRQVAQASRRGIDVTLARCIGPAKNLTPVVTGTAQGSIMMKAAKIVGKFVTGKWGSWDVEYFIWLEIGAHGRRAYRMLQQTADAQYPKLPAHILHEMRRAA